MYSRMTISQAVRARYQRRSGIKSVEGSRWLILLGMAHLAGVALGCEIFLRSAGGYEDGVFAIFEQFLSVRATQPISETVISSFLSTFYLLAALFLLGFCAVSLPIIPLIPLFKGLGYGITMSAALQTVGQEHLGKLLLLVVPYAAATGCVVIVAAGYAARLSLRCYQIVRQGKGMGSELGVQDYCQTFLVLVVLTALFALMDATLYSVIAGGILI